MKKLKSEDEFRSVRPRAVALLSGGLDSTLAAAIVGRAGIDVIGIFVKNLFETDRHREEHLRRAVDQLGIPLRVVDRSDEHLTIVRHPRHGYGSGMNPCIDCHIFMLRIAKEAMADEKAQFVVTGEVLGQRPMSQHRHALLLVAEESGLNDRLLRPLSANLLPDTLPVKKGWIKKDDLYAISGRGRAPQRALAREFAITDYPQPAGGCLLTERVYAVRVRDAFAHIGPDKVDRDGFRILRYGRQFRIAENVKVIIGRNEEENEILAQFRAGRIAIEPITAMGPLTLVEGNPNQDELRLAVALAGRYCDHLDDSPIAFTVTKHNKTEKFLVPPLPGADPHIDSWRI